jgi:hypothetical protein
MISFVVLINGEDAYSILVPEKLFRGETMSGKGFFCS